MTKPRHRKRSKEQSVAISALIPNSTVGIDLGDNESCYRIVNEQGDTVKEGCVPTNREEFQKFFRTLPRSRVVMEAGTHSPWVSRCAQEEKHEVVVVNTRKAVLTTSTSPIPQSQQTTLDDRAGRPLRHMLAGHIK